MFPTTASFFRSLPGAVAKAAVAALVGAVVLTACAGTPSSRADAARPAWVDAPDAVYPAVWYVTAVGHGSTRRLAEQDALGRLTAIFGQSVQAELQAVERYAEAVTGGVIQVAQDLQTRSAFVISTEMDALLGVEVGAVWQDPAPGSGELFYALAVMERETAAVLYGDLVRSNLRLIDELVAQAEAEPDSLDGYSRCLLAADIARANQVYARVLSYLGVEGFDAGSMKTGADYELLAGEFARNIPIGVVITGDRSGRIAAALTGALTGLGFRRGTASSRYVVEGALSLEPVDLPNQQNIFVRYLVEVELRDAAAGVALLSYSATGREGHLTASEAEERALKAAEQKLPGEFAALLKERLTWGGAD